MSLSPVEYLRHLEERLEELNHENSRPGPIGRMCDVRVQTEVEADAVPTVEVSSSSPLWMSWTSFLETSSDVALIEQETDVTLKEPGSGGAYLSLLESPFFSQGHRQSTTRCSPSAGTFFSEHSSTTELS